MAVTELGGPLLLLETGRLNQTPEAGVELRQVCWPWDEDFNRDGLN